MVVAASNCVSRIAARRWMSAGRRRDLPVFETTEGRRLADSEARQADWKHWGPYVSDRAWGTVREDYSPTPVKVRSFVGLLPLLAVETLEPEPQARAACKPRQLWERMHHVNAQSIGRGRRAV